MASLFVTFNPNMIKSLDTGNLTTRCSGTSTSPSNQSWSILGHKCSTPIIYCHHTNWCHVTNCVHAVLALPAPVICLSRQETGGFCHHANYIDRQNCWAISKWRRTSKSLILSHVNHRQCSQMIGKISDDARPSFGAKRKVHVTSPHENCHKTWHYL